MDSLIIALVTFLSIETFVVFSLSVMALGEIIFFIIMIIMFSENKRHLNKRIDNIDLKITGLQLPYNELVHSLNKLHESLNTLR